MKPRTFPLEIVRGKLSAPTESKAITRGVELLSTQMLFPIRSRNIFQFEGRILVVERSPNPGASGSDQIGRDFSVHFFDSTSAQYKNSIRFRMLDVLEENALSHAYYSQGFGFLDGRLYVNEHSGSDGHFAEHIFGLNGELLCLFTNDTAVVDKATGLAELVPKHFIDPVVGRVVPISNTRRFVSFETYYRGQGFGRTRWSLYDRKELARKLFETGQELEPWPTAFEWNLKHENSMFASDDAGIWSVEPDGNVAFTPRQIGSWDSGRVIESTVPIDPRRVEHYPALAGNRELLLENWELDNFEWTDRKTYTYTYCWIDQNQLLQQCTYDLLSGFAELCAGLGLDNRYEVWFVHPQHLLSGLALFSVFIKPTGNPQDLKELILIVNILSGDNILFELRVPASQSEEARNVLG